MPGVIFSSQNMQISGTEAHGEEAFFKNIPFDKVYHEGAYTDQSIKSHRCAEVLTPSPLELVSSLKEIWFRSEPERDTLLNMLGGDKERWRDYCRVSDAIKAFEKNYTFLEEISLTEQGVLFALNHRRDRQGIHIQIDVWRDTGEHVVQFVHSDHAAKPSTGGRWIYEAPLAEGGYNVRVHLERHLAFDGPLHVGSSLF